MLRSIIIASTLVPAFVWAAVPAASENRVGVVLMHGSKGTARPNSPIGPLIVALRRAGILVAAPDMPWSRTRHLSKAVKGSLEEIDRAVADLKRQGAVKIVVGGHSIGANAAMAYGARRKGLAGILALAPGHVPSVSGWQKKMKFDYRRAERLINEGRGKVKAEFRFHNQGRTSTERVTPEVYFSWFDPQGAANYRKNAEKLWPGTALLWIVGRKDIMARRGRNFAFGKVPVHPKSKYVEVAGGHLATPRVGAKIVIAWLRLLD